MLVLLAGCLVLAPPCEEVGEGYVDGDDDGFGAGERVTACAESLVPTADDCDDVDPGAYPGAEEVWYDGVLQDCSGKDDDRDGDGIGIAEDCDDDDAAVHPGAEESWYDGVDGDCDGLGDYDQDEDGADSDRYGGDDCDDLDPAVGPDVEEVWYDGFDANCDGADDYDQDADGHPALDWGDDCDDATAEVYPGAAETCDGLDNDCNGATDEGFDLDGDLFVSCVDDCDDAAADVYPGAPEACDGRDEDCDGTADEDYDVDADGWATCAGDCDDGAAGVNPAETEVWYDGVDADCDGADDYDQDADGADADAYGGTDCDDTDASVYVGAPDTWYDGVDANCDAADDYDQDADGHSSDAYGGDDCDDLRAATYPGATDAWYDGVDADCDGASDYDRDADGQDAEAYGGADCDDTTASTYSGATDAWYDGVDANCDDASDFDQDADGFDADDWGGADCDDTDTTFSPDAPDELDGADQDCDGILDNAVAGEVAAAMIVGVSTGAHIGAGGVRFADDTDGDGEDELVIATPDEGTNSGAVWVFGASELSATATVEDAWLTLEGGVGDEAGAAIAVGLDWDADGVEEVVIGAPGTASVYVTEPGSATSSSHAASSLAYATLTGVAASDFGASVATGDLDGDGVDDLAVGAPGTSKGAIYLFLGAAGAASTAYGAADYTVPGADAGDAIGAVLGGGGDTDADGYDDLCVGVPGDDENSRTNSGSTFLLRGASLFVNLGLSVESVTGWTLTGSAASQAVGSTCAIADVASSANADVFVGATGYSGGGYTGAVGVFYGSASGTESFTAADRLIRGGGAAVGGGADLDADGAADLLVGDHDVAWIVSLATAGTLDLPDDAPGYWTQGSDQLGAALDADARDLDGDGALDVAVAATAGEGAVYLLRVFP